MAATMRAHELEEESELEFEEETELEFEEESELEGELEFEDEWEGEGEAEFEAESEWEWEREGESEGEFEAEAEAFFSRLAGLARRAAQSPALQRVGLAAARSALRGAGRVRAAVGGAAAGREGAQAGRAIGGQLGALLSRLLPQQEFEGESEDEYEINPIARIYPDVLLEHLGHAAARAESEAEAEAFVRAMVPVAARIAPRAARAVTRAAPQLTRGLTNVARTLRSVPAARPLVQTLPTIARRTVNTLVRQAARGRPITPRGAAQTLARQTLRVVGSPRQATSAYRRSQRLDRRFHRVAPGAARQLQRPVRYGLRPGMRSYGRPVARPGRLVGGRALRRPIAGGQVVRQTVMPSGRLVRQVVTPAGQVVRQVVTPAGQVVRQAIAPSRQVVRQTTGGTGICACGSAAPARVVSQPVIAQPVIAQPVMAQPAMCDCATVARICPNCGGLREY